MTCLFDALIGQRSFAMVTKEKIHHLIFHFLRWGMGCFFLFVATMKLFQIDELQTTIEQFDLFPYNWGHPLACLGLAGEFVIGAGLLFRKTCSGAALLGCGLTFSFVVLFVQGWWRGLSLSCNCIGVEHEATHYPFEVAWRVGLFLLMVAILWHALREGKAQVDAERLDFSEM